MNNKLNTVYLKKILNNALLNNKINHIKYNSLLESISFNDDDDDDIINNTISMYDKRIKLYNKALSYIEKIGGYVELYTDDNGFMYETKDSCKYKIKAPKELNWKINGKGPDAWHRFYTDIGTYAISSIEVNGITAYINIIEPLIYEILYRYGNYLINNSSHYNNTYNKSIYNKGIKLEIPCDISINKYHFSEIILHILTDDDLMECYCINHIVLIENINGIKMPTGNKDSIVKYPSKVLKALLYEIIMELLPEDFDFDICFSDDKWNI